MGLITPKVSKWLIGLYDADDERVQSVAKESQTTSLLCETLKKMGCDQIENEQDEINPERHWITFQYQGETHQVWTEDNMRWRRICVWDPDWYELSTNCDVEKCSKLQDIINMVTTSTTIPCIIKFPPLLKDKYIDHP